MKFIFAIIVGLVVSVSGFSQVVAPAQTTNIPPCIQPFSQTGVGLISVFNNLQTQNPVTGGCDSWLVVFQSTGFSAVTATVYGGQPGNLSDWVSSGGTVVSGTLPITTITQTQVGLSGYFQNVGLYVTSVTGSGRITGTIYGFRTDPNTGTGGGGSGGASVNLTQINGSPVLTTSGSNIPYVAILDANNNPIYGANDPCQTSNQATKIPFSVNVAANTLLVPVTAGLNSYVCDMQIVMTSGSLFLSIVSGTGTACATGCNMVKGGTLGTVSGAPTDATGGFSFALAVLPGIALGDGGYTIANTVNLGDALYALMSGTGRVTISGHYATH